jgi:hypothetical protein
VKEKWLYIVKKSACPSLDELKSYLEGTLHTEKLHSVEDHLVECDICNDLLEGMHLIGDPTKINEAEIQIKVKLNDLLSSDNRMTSNRFIRRAISVAASVLILTFSIFAVYYFTGIKQKLFSPKTIENKPVNTVRPDTTDLLNMNNGPDNKKTFVQANQSQVLPSSESVTASSNEINKKNDKQAEHVTSAEKNSVALKDESHKWDTSVSNRPKDKDHTGDDNSMEQTIVIRKTIIYGKLTANDGKPISGALVTVKGKSIASTTDDKGDFKMIVHNIDSVVVVSCSGYKTKEVLVKSKKSDDKYSSPDIIRLDAINEKSDDLNTTKSKQLNKNSREIDSLKVILIMHKDDRNSLVLLIEKYLENENQSEALKELQILQRQTNDSRQSKLIKEVIELTKESKYSSALRKLNSIK